MQGVGRAEGPEFSVDSKRGEEIFRLDVSLMERLSTSGLPMSQLQVQRRMRPEISALIRYDRFPRFATDSTAIHCILNSRTTKVSWTRLIFAGWERICSSCKPSQMTMPDSSDHNHKETGGQDAGMSKYNTFEVTPAFGRD